MNKILLREKKKRMIIVLSVWLDVPAAFFTHVEVCRAETLARKARQETSLWRDRDFFLRQGLQPLGHLTSPKFESEGNSQ